MSPSFSSSIIVFYTIFLFIIPQPCHQYIYSCDSSAAACGCSPNPASVNRIVGGESARTNTWGWAVSISIKSSSLCGGAILSSSWIITAAHCLSDVLPSEIRIYAGSNIRFAGQSRMASRIIVHPYYVDTTKVNDIALIQLSTPLAMTSMVKTICMPFINSSILSNGEWPPAGLYVVAIGWGRLSEMGSLPIALQQVTVKTIDYRASMCRSVLNNRQLQFCAGVSGGGKDTCQGDSGGPLMMFTKSRQWVLVGVTSYGIGCAQPNFAGVYTRIASYQNWIAMMTSNAYINVTSSESAKINPFTDDFEERSEASSMSYSLAFIFVLLLFISEKYTLF